MVLQIAHFTILDGGGVWRLNNINVNGSNNNGLYVANGTSDIYATNITVVGGVDITKDNKTITTYNNGILVGSEYGESASVDIGASSIDAKKTNGKGAGIYLYAGDITFTTPNNYTVITTSIYINVSSFNNKITITSDRTSYTIIMSPVYIKIISI